MVIQRTEKREKRASKMKAKASKVEKVYIKEVAKVECLKEVLKGTEDRIFWEKKRWLAKEKVTEVEKKVDEQAIEMDHQAMEAFRVFKKLAEEKASFAMEAFNAGQEVCHRRSKPTFSS